MWLRTRSLFVLAISAVTFGASGTSRAQNYDLSFVNYGGTPVVLDGYTLTCEAGCLDPDGWVSIQDSVEADAARVIAELGAGGLTFGEAVATSHNLSELNLPSHAVLQPGARWSLGRPIAGNAREVSEWIDAGSLTVTVSGRAIVYEIGFPLSPGQGGDFVVEFTRVPEPSSMLAAVISTLGLVLLRRPGGWLAAPRMQ